MYSVKPTKQGDPRDDDTGKKVWGRKRHLLVDTLGLLLIVVVHAASLQDRHGATLVCLRAWPILTGRHGPFSSLPCRP
jgi:putative transposase